MSVGQMSLPSMTRSVGIVGAGQLRESRQQIHRGHEFVVGLARRDLSGPADRRWARACRLRRWCPCCHASGPALAKRCSSGAVVGGEKDERVFVETVGLERVEDLADGPVDFGDGLTEELVPRLVVDVAVFRLQRRHDVVGDAFHERRRNVQRRVGNGMRDVEKERLVLVPLDE